MTPLRKVTSDSPKSLQDLLVNDSHFHTAPLKVKRVCLGRFRLSFSITSGEWGSPLSPPVLPSMLRGALSISRRFPSRAAGSPCGWCSFSPLPSWPPWLACAGQRDRSTATATRCHLPCAPDRGQWFCSYFQMIHILLFPLPPKHFFVFYVIVSLHQPLIFPRRHSSQ